jgi:DNA replication and repair protein RecF
MFFVRNISIKSFKNLGKVDVVFEKKNIAFTGSNGAGKTNLLDAIYYLTLGKSYFNSIDQQNVKNEEEFFNLKADFEINKEAYQLFCGFAKGRKKAFKVNDNAYDKLSEHIGRFPAVIITPYDQELIQGNSEERRKFLDLIISQINRDYLENLIKYNKTLAQRNALLKKMFEQKTRDFKLLTIYDKQLSENGKRIYQERKNFLKRFQEFFYELYQAVSQTKEGVKIDYKSQMHEDHLEELLKKNRERDILLQRTTAGIHKDDIELTKDEMPAKKFTSQGQQKSVLIAMKLAQHKILEAHNGFPPVLLIDDLFDRLDEKRSLNFLEKITQKDFGQVFITDTNKERVLNRFNKIDKSIKVFELEDGSVK